MRPKFFYILFTLSLCLNASCAEVDDWETIPRQLDNADTTICNTDVDTLICSFKKYMTLQPKGKYSAQGSACYGDYFIQGYAYNEYVTVYNLREKVCLGTIQVPAPAPSSRTHCNTLNFGGQKYHPDDYFPLLYVSSGYSTNGVSFIYVYRLTKELQDGIEHFSLLLVQTISLRGYDSWTEGIVDAVGNKLWIKSKEGERLKYSCYNMPDVFDKDADIICGNNFRGFLVDKIPANSRNQGHLFSHDRILLVTGVPQSDEAVAFITINIQTENFEHIIDLAEVGLTNPNNPKDGYYEPEGVIYYNDQLMICYRKAIYAFSIERKKKSEQTE